MKPSTYKILSYVFAALAVVFAIPLGLRAFGYDLIDPSYTKSVPSLVVFAFVFPTLYFAKKAQEKPEK